MKKTLLISIFLFFGITFIKAQIVNIPDTNFKAVLVNNALINTNADTEIQVTEANALTGTLDVAFKNITDLTGIEAFTSITELRCYHNQLTTLDLTNNTALTTVQTDYNQLVSINLNGLTSLSYLGLTGNQFSSIDLSTNTTLRSLYLDQNPLNNVDLNSNTALEFLYINNVSLTTLDLSNNVILKTLKATNNFNLTSINVSDCPLLNILECHSNNLNSLDVSNNTALTELKCHSNSQLTDIDLFANVNLTKVELFQTGLTSIDLSNNSSLTSISCFNNHQLTSLNIKNGNNSNMIVFGATNCTSLTCIQVDDSASFSNTWNGAKDVTAIYSNNCNYTTSVSENTFENKFSVYPNPAKDYITINAIEPNQFSILNVIGQEVIKTKINGIETINISDLENGIYFVRDLKNQFITKFIKE